MRGHGGSVSCEGPQARPRRGDQGLAVDLSRMIPTAGIRGYSRPACREQGYETNRSGSNRGSALRLPGLRPLRNREVHRAQSAPVLAHLMELTDNGMNVPLV